MAGTNEDLKEIERRFRLRQQTSPAFQEKIDNLFKNPVIISNIGPQQSSKINPEKTNRSNTSDKN
jgi:hypothetical protein